MAPTLVFNKFLCSCVFLIALFGVSVLDPIRPPCDMKRLDKCSLKSLIFADPNGFIATSKKELAERGCIDDGNSIKCMRESLNNCRGQVRPLARQVVSLIIQGAETMLKKRCTDSDHQKEYIPASQCISKYKAGFDKCMLNFVEESHRISKSGEKEKRIDMLCCRFNRYLDCNLGIVRKECNDHYNFMEDFFNGYAGDVLDLVCADEHKVGSDFCDELDLPDLEYNETLPLSAVPPSIVIFSDF